MTASSSSETACTAGDTLTITAQEAQLIQLVRNCRAQRTASEEDLSNFMAADALTKVVVELLDGYTVEFAQALFSEATQLMHRTTVFTTASTEYQRHLASVERFHGQLAEFRKEHAPHSGSKFAAHV